MPKTPIDMVLDGAQWQPVAWDEKPDDGIPYATHEGTVDIGGIVLKCYQLSDGRRVFDADDVNRLFGGDLFD